MQACMWRLTEQHALFYTDDRATLRAILAYARFPYRDAAKATTTYTGKNGRVFAWQFVIPYDLWNGVVRYLGKEAITVLDPETRNLDWSDSRATPPQPERTPVSIARKAMPQPVAAKPGRAESSSSKPSNPKHNSTKPTPVEQSPKVKAGATKEASPHALGRRSSQPSQPVAVEAKPPMMGQPKPTRKPAASTTPELDPKPKPTSTPAKPTPQPASSPPLAATGPAPRKRAGAGPGAPQLQASPTAPTVHSAPVQPAAVAKRKGASASPPSQMQFDLAEATLPVAKERPEVPRSKRRSPPNSTASDQEMELPDIVTRGGSKRRQLPVAPPIPPATNLPANAKSAATKPRSKASPAPGVNRAGILDPPQPVSAVPAPPSRPQSKGGDRNSQSRTDAATIAPLGPHAHAPIRTALSESGKPQAPKGRPKPAQGNALGLTEH